MVNLDDEINRTTPQYGPDIRGNNERILVIDDDDGVRKTIEKYLSEFNYVPTVVSKPGYALPQLLESEFDAIICDFEMPEIKGAEVYKTIRDAGYTGPFIFFTGAALDEANQELQNAQVPASEYVVHMKPASTEMLRSLRNLLDGLYGNGENILLVGDEPVTDALKPLLEKHKYNVTAVQNDTDAAIEAGMTKYDIVVAPEDLSSNTTFTGFVLEVNNLPAAYISGDNKAVFTNDTLGDKHPVALRDVLKDIKVALGDNAGTPDNPNNCDSG